MSFNKGVLNLVLIGAKNSGKTVFLSSLWGKGLLSDTDSDTKEYLKRNWDYIESNYKAQATSGMLKILNFSFQDKQFGRVEFSIDDYDGKFTETISQDDENTRIEREKLKQSIKESEGCLFFIPFEETPERLKDFSQEIDAFIQLAQFNSHNKSPIPASIVVTKWDESESFKDPEEKNKALNYIKSNEYLTRAIKVIKSHFEYTELIPLSSFKDHNLLAPINFSLENTFRQWFDRANNLNETKEFEKLCKYLSIRWEDIKFNKKYDFKSLYENGQVEFAKQLNSRIQQKQSIDEKETELYKYKSYFLTKEDLFKQIEDVVLEEKRSLKRKRFIKSFSIGIVVSISGILILLKITASNADEEYKKVLSGYEKGLSYKDLKKPIDNFLLKNNIGDFTLAFFDIETARNKINNIKIELLKKEQAVKQKILSDDTLSATKKEVILKQTTNIQNDKDTKERLEYEKKIEDNKKALKKWKNDTRLCLKTQCIVDKNGKEIIENLLSQSKSIPQDNEVINLKEKLISKYQYITFNLTLKNIDNFEDILILLNNHDSYTFEQSKIIFEKVSTIKDINNDREFSYYTANYDDNIIKRDGIVKILNEINHKHNIYKDYLQLIKTISNSSLDELDNIEKKNWSLFSKKQQDDIKSKLKKRFDSLFYNIVVSEIPLDLFNKIANNSWIDNRYKSFIEKCNLTQFDFKYNYIKHTYYNKVAQRLEKIKIIDNLRTYGIDNISVTIEGLEDNSIDFGCGINWNGRSSEEIIIKGFDTLLSYKNNGASKCANNKRTFKSTITLKSNDYRLKLIEYNIGPSYELDSQNIQFTINDIYNLYNFESVSKDVDDGKIKLIFRR